MVLDVQWLITLRPILWDFQQLTMQFFWKDQEVIWKGQVDGQVLFMSRKQASKVHGAQSA